MARQAVWPAKWSWALGLQQVLFPLDFWLEYPGLDGVNYYNALRPSTDTFPTYPPSATDVSNLRRLAKQFSLMLPYLDGLLQGSSFAEHLVLAARNLRSSRLEFETEIESLTPAVALVMQSLITSATWNMTASATEKTTSYYIRWYVYGSGLRLFWQWATGAVLSVLVLTLSYDVYLVLRYRIALGPWLTLGGMMNAANAGKRLRSVRTGCAGATPEEGKRMKYYVRDVGDWKAEITDDATNVATVEKGKRYGELGD